MSDAGADGAVLQRGGVVVEFDQFGKARADIVQHGPDGCRPASSRSRVTPPGTMMSRIRRWPKAASAARKTLSRNIAAMGVHQREGGIVADRADVAEMIGEPLQFRQQRAQPDRARSGTARSSAASAACENA